MISSKIGYISEQFMMNYEGDGFLSLLRVGRHM